MKFCFFSFRKISKIWNNLINFIVPWDQWCRNGYGFVGYSGAGKPWVQILLWPNYMVVLFNSKIGLHKTVGCLVSKGAISPSFSCKMNVSLDYFFDSQKVIYYLWFEQNVLEQNLMLYVLINYEVFVTKEKCNWISKFFLAIVCIFCVCVCYSCVYDCSKIKRDAFTIVSKLFFLYFQFCVFNFYEEGLVM